MQLTRRLFPVLLLLLPATLFGGSLHGDVLHTQVRVRTAEAGGSGTVIYSLKDDQGFYSTYVITCHHVVEGALKVEEKWDSLLAKDRKREMRRPVSVEFFEWDAVPHGKPPLTSGARADVVAYDQRHDMALLHIRLARKPPVAPMLPRGQATEVTVGSPVTVVGCALGHDPIVTSGIVTHLGDVIDYADYWMSNAQTIFGNSGGAVFLNKGAGEYGFIGIPSRIAVVGWSDAVTHMGYFSPITRVYDFMEEQIFDFLVPGSDKTEAQCAEEREKKRELEEKKLRLE